MGITYIQTDKQFTHIVHLADIHIRLTRRHEEYRQVFNKLYENIRQTPDTTAIFVLGDVVNSKLDLSPECVDLVVEFLWELAELRPTILIPGNHDCNLSNKNRMDSLSPVVDALKHPNLTYVTESGLYGFGNICINNYSIFDEPDKYLKGKDIPPIYRNKYELFIATYHGTVHGAKTDLGFVLSNPSVTVDMFDNHDLVLLGDIHKMQDLQIGDSAIKPFIRYPGSLIQQKHDEPLSGHGYSLWDLENFEYEHVDIPNDCGFFTVTMQDGLIVSDLKNLPKKVHLRIKKTNTTISEEKKAIADIGQLADIIPPVSVEKEKTDDVIARLSGNVVLGDVENKSYQTQIITEYAQSKLNITDQSFIDAIIRVNDDVNNLIPNDDYAKNIKWKPIRFEWENMFSYGKGNVIDFTKTKNLIGIFAANRSGKSSIFSALTFCLFDKCERDYKAVNVMHSAETTFNCKFEFEIDGVKYFIKRNAEADKKGKVKVNVKFWKVENGQEIDLNGDERNDTNSEIRKYLGTYDDFILTCLSVQNGKNNISIIDMGDADRKELFSQFMGLTIFDKLHTEANEHLKERLVKLKSYRTEDHSQKLITMTNLLEQAENVYAAEKDSLANIESEKEKLQQTILETTKQLIKLDVQIPSIDQSKLDVEKYKSCIENVNNSIKNYEDSLNELLKRLEITEKEIQELENKNVVELYEKRKILDAQQKELDMKRNSFKEIYLQNMKIYEQAKSIEYDENCSFCVKNAGKVAIDAKNASNKMKQIQEDATALKTNSEAMEQVLTDIQWANASYLCFTELVTRRYSLKDEKNKITDRIIYLQQQLPKYQANVTKCETDIELYNNHRDSVEFNNKINLSIAKLTNELANVEYNYKTKNKNVMDVNAKILLCKQKIRELTITLDDIKILENEYKIYEAYCKATSHDGIPFDIIMATIPEVQSEVNSILSQITDFTALFETDGKSIIPYILYGGKKWLMSMASGFEKFALSLAIRVALINISNLPRSNFLIIDEGFGTIDAENLVSLQSLFDYLKSNFDFILIVSHIDTLRDFVDNHIEITKDNGYSKVIYG